MRQDPKHVVIIGGGFGGLRVARQLRRANVRVTLVDRANHHLFQPLLYQVATTSLTAEEIASPIRSILRPDDGCQVILGEAERVDLAARRVHLADETALDYDYLVVAAGAETNDFGNASWRPYMVGLKELEDAFELRRRVLMAFERAEQTLDPDTRAQLMTFAVVGGGPTGVEMAGAFSELGRTILRRDFTRLDPASMRVVLVEMGPRVLPPFHPKLSANAQKELEGLGVEVMTQAQVSDVGPEGLVVNGALIPASVICWAAGVKPRPLAARLGTPLAGRGGQVQVEADCSLPGHPEAFCIGDMAHFVPVGESRPLPGVAPVAMQEGVHVAKTIRRHLAGKPSEPFVYFDKGAMATIGTWRAVLEFRGLKMTGPLAWLGWIAVHVFYIIGFRNRLLVLIEWGWALLAKKRGARLLVAPAANRPWSQAATPPPGPGGAAQQVTPAGAQA